MKQIIFILVISLFLVACKKVAPVSQTTDSPSPQTQSDNQTVSFGTAKKSAHYVSNTPEHGSTQSAVPKEVVINFNFDLATNSTISITSAGKEHGLGKVTFDANKRTMRIAIDPSAADGVYTVSYNACWPDKSCHDGNFQFAIKRS